MGWWWRLRAGGALPTGWYAVAAGRKTPSQLLASAPRLQVLCAGHTVFLE